jgi:hypothetical protein
MSIRYWTTLSDLAMNDIRTKEGSTESNDASYDANEQTTLRKCLCPGEQIQFSEPTFPLSRYPGEKRVYNTCVTP